MEQPKIYLIEVDDGIFILEEYVGDEPVRYDCTAQSCWRDCVPCCFCEASKMVKLEGWDEWRDKHNKREIIKCNPKDNRFWNRRRLGSGNVKETEIEVIGWMAHKKVIINYSI